MQDESHRQSARDVRRQRALAHPDRRALLGYLLQRKNEKGTTGWELVDALGLMASMVRYHLRVLLSADLVACLANVPEPGGVEGPYVAAAAGL